MKTVQVTTTANHLSNNIMHVVGDVYETAADNAKILKGNGLVDYDGEGVVVKGRQLLDVRDGAQTTTAVVEQGPNNQGDLIPVNKKSLSVAKQADKANSIKKAAGSKVKEKVENPVVKPEKVENPTTSPEKAES